MSHPFDQGGFYGAAQARQIAMGASSGPREVLTEINALRTAIDEAAHSSNLTVEVSENTPMTDSEAFFNTWSDPYHFDEASDRLNRAKMAEVIKYFSRLGYRITRERNGLDSTFKWVITW